MDRDLQKRKKFTLFSNQRAARGFISFPNLALHVKSLPTSAVEPFLFLNQLQISSAKRNTLEKMWKPYPLTRFKIYGYATARIIKPALVKWLTDIQLGASEKKSSSV